MSDATFRNTNGIKTACLITFVIASVYRFPVDDPRELFFVFFEVSAAVVFGFLLWRINRWMAVFLWLAVMSRFIPIYSQESYIAFTRIFYGLVWYYIVVVSFSKADVSLLMDVMIIIAAAHVFFLTLQLFNADPLAVPLFQERDAPTGLMSNRNEVSALLAFTVPACIRPFRRRFIPMLILGLILAKSLGGVVASGVGITVCAFLTGIRFAWLVPVGAVIAGALYVTFVAIPALRRIEVIEVIMTHFYPQHPWVGSGIGHWDVIFTRLKLLPDKSKFFRYEFAHNDYLQALFEMGIGYAVTQAGFVFRAIKKYHAEALVSATALATIATSCMYHWTFHNGITGMFAVTWLAIYEIQTAR